MIEFLTNLMINIFLVFLFILEFLYLFYICMYRHTFKNDYSKSEFIKDFFIPFRKWYMNFYNLFKD